MRGLFDDDQEPHACIECSHFAGRSRDRTGELFRQAKGYCLHDGHPGGTWNVVQDILKKQHCKNFRRADDEMIESRRRAIDWYRSKSTNRRR